MDSIAKLLAPVSAAGCMALTARKVSFLEREVKDDNSIVTEVDRMVERFLVGEIKMHYPDANILAEEGEFHYEYDPEKAFSFALDPIDGTDAFSQGMGGWCISLGLLDQKLTPIAGIIFAPQQDLWLFADVGKAATLNGEPVSLAGREESLSTRSNIMVPSSVHQQLDLSGYPGKIRSIGSAALHLSGPVIYRGVFASVDGRKGRIWDIAAAHAINLSVGYKLEYLAGGDVDYSAMIGGGSVGDMILAGSKQRIDALREVLRKTP